MTWDKRKQQKNLHNRIASPEYLPFFWNEKFVAASKSRIVQYLLRVYSACKFHKMGCWKYIILLVISDNIWWSIATSFGQKPLSKTFQDRGTWLTIQLSQDSSGETLWMEKDCYNKCCFGLFLVGKIQCFHCIEISSLASWLHVRFSGWIRLTIPWIETIDSFSKKKIYIYMFCFYFFMEAGENILLITTYVGISNSYTGPIDC